MAGRKRDKKVPPIWPPAPVKAVPSVARRVLNPPAEGTFSVRWSKFDHDGPWGLARCDGLTIEAITRRIGAMETMSMTEVFSGNPGKDYDVDQVIVPAQDRLKQLGYEDEDRISRIQIDGPSRLYGIRRVNEFYALWWDPEHEICPSTKRHT